MLLGTHTSEEEQNHLLLAEVHLPTEDSELSSAQYDEESTEIGGYGASPGYHLQLLLESQQAKDIALTTSTSCIHMHSTQSCSLVLHSH